MEKAGKRDHGTRLLTLALAVLLLCMVLAGCGEKPLTLDEQLELGVRYLNDLDYENAVIAFTAAIELDGQNPRARAGLCAAYLAQGDEEQAAQAWAAALDAGIPESDLLAELERMAGILAAAGDESVQKTIEDKKTPAELPKDADYSAYEGREIQLTITPTGTQADSAINYDGYGSLILNGEMDEFGYFSPQTALINNNGEFVFPYLDANGSIYIYSDGIVTLEGILHYSESDSQDGGYYLLDGTPALTIQKIEDVNYTPSDAGVKWDWSNSAVAYNSFHDGIAFVRQEVSVSHWSGIAGGAFSCFKSYLVDKNGNTVLTLPDAFNAFGTITEDNTLVGGTAPIAVNGDLGSLGWASEGLINFGCYARLEKTIFSDVDMDDITWNSPYLCGYMDYSGNIVIPQQYFDTIPFSEGLAAVKNENGLWGFIDKTGNTVIPMEYESVYSFRDGLAAVSKGGKTGYINASNELVIPMEYEDGFEAGGGVCPVAQNGKYGLIDYSGQQVLPFEYDDISVCADGVVYAIKDQTVYIITVEV